MKKAGNLIAEILSKVFPSGVAENLMLPVVEGQKSPIRMLFDETFADIAKWIEGEREDNVDLVEFCKTNFKNAMTILPKPHGVVTRVFTVDSGDYTKPVYYTQVDWPLPQVQAQRWAQRVKSTAPTSLPLGRIPADASTDSPSGRAHAGIWCNHEGNIYMWPWIQSTELVAVEWNGIKKEWHDDDVVTDDQDYIRAVTDYFIYRYNFYWGSAEKRDAAKLEFESLSLPDLHHEDRLRRKRLVRDEPPIVPDRHWPAFFGPGTQSDVRGSVQIPLGASGGTVTGLNLNFTPRIPTLTVSGPTNGLVMTANVQGDMTTDGFTYVLSGVTDSSEYVLNYELS